MKAELNQSGISVDPINGFYQKYQATKLDVINSTVDTWLKQARDQIDAQLKQYQQQIKQFEKQMQDEATVKGIHQKIINNKLIFGSCFIIFGLFFLAIYFGNKKVIKEYEQYCENIQKQINQVKNKIFHLIYDHLGSMRTSYIVNQIFNQYGLISCSQIDTYSVMSKLQRPNVVGIDKAHLVFYKNTPIYDLKIRQITVKNVQTTGRIMGEITVPGGYTIPMLFTAHHDEPTPFIEPNNCICLFSNYLQPNFSFISSTLMNGLNQRYTETINVNGNQTMLSKIKDFAGDILNSHKKSHNINIDNKSDNVQLENDQFNAKVHFNWRGEQSDLVQFFTIKVQEDFVKWNDQECNLANQKFAYGNYTFYNEKTSEVPFLNYYESILITCGYGSANSIANIDDIDELKLKLKKIIVAYLDDWFKAVQLPLLVTGINREWYQKNGQYLIASTDDVPNINEQTSWRYILNKWHNFFVFHMNNPARESWIDIAKFEPIDNTGFSKINLNLRSFRSQQMIAYEPAYHGLSMRRVPVPYEKFFPIQEPKRAYCFSTTNWPKGKNLRIILGLRHGYENTSNYSDEIKAMFNNAPFHISDPLVLSQSSYHQTILKTLSTFHAQNPDFVKHCLIITSNQYNGIILVDDPAWFDQNEMEDKVRTLAHSLNIE